MALTNTQLVTVAEIVLETFDTVESLASSLNAEQETSIIVDLALWATIRNSHVKLKGGTKAVDFDQERKREAIRRRIRKMLGLSLISDEIMPGSHSIPLVWRY